MKTRHSKRYNVRVQFTNGSRMTVQRLAMNPQQAMRYALYGSPRDSDLALVKMYPAIIAVKATLAK